MSFPRAHQSSFSRTRWMCLRPSQPNPWHRSSTWRLSVRTDSLTLCTLSVYLSPPLLTTILHRTCLYRSRHLPSSVLCCYWIFSLSPTFPLLSLSVRQMVSRALVLMKEWSGCHSTYQNWRRSNNCQKMIYQSKKKLIKYDKRTTNKPESNGL